MDITGKITGIKYTPYLYDELQQFDIKNIDKAMSKSAFLLRDKKGNMLAISKWVSPKRTRSYPYERVYNTLGYSCKKITIIPFVKDEGSDGDRDFLQWDTISLMSLLEINVIIAYYDKAEKNNNYENKITNQEFDLEYIKRKIDEISSYHSSALHWNMQQIDEMGDIGLKSYESYEMISKKLNVKMHKMQTIKDRIKSLKNSRQTFINESRERSSKAQQREIKVVHDSELLDANKKAPLTITNFLGGNYCFTIDEAWVKENNIYLVEGKNTRSKGLPSKSDIKDALLSMVLFTNLVDVKVNDESFNPKPAIKLTSNIGIERNKLSNNDLEVLNILEKEAMENNFNIIINEETEIKQTKKNKVIKSPLRYPGGKSRAIKKIDPIIPRNYKEFREPFVGGGSVFLHSKQCINDKAQYVINDLNIDLISFWKVSRDRNIELVKKVQEIKDITSDGRGLHRYLVENNSDLNEFEKAVRFFILNRITFSGTADSGGYSKQSFERRFTDSSIERVRMLEEVMQDVEIYNKDYKYFLEKEGEEVFIFLDPPYYNARESRLYGKKGDLHMHFDYEEFANSVRECKHKWLITLDDSPIIRELFSFANIYEWELQYGMNNYKQGRAAKGKELFITNYKI